MVCHDEIPHLMVEIVPFTNFVKDYVSSTEVPATSPRSQDLTE
jgi:hypothetical protein